MYKRFQRNYGPTWILSLVKVWQALELRRAVGDAKLDQKHLDQKHLRPSPSKPLLLLLLLLLPSMTLEMLRRTTAKWQSVFSRVGQMLG